MVLHPSFNRRISHLYRVGRDLLDPHDGWMLARPRRRRLRSVVLGVDHRWRQVPVLGVIRGDYVFEARGEVVAREWSFLPDAVSPVAEVSQWHARHGVRVAQHLVVVLVVDVAIGLVELVGQGAVDLVPPVAGEELLTEDRAHGAEERGDQHVVADVEQLASRFFVRVVAWHGSIWFHIDRICI